MSHPPSMRACLLTGIVLIQFMFKESEQVVCIYRGIKGTHGHACAGLYVATINDKRGHESERVQEGSGLKGGKGRGK